MDSIVYCTHRPDHFALHAHIISMFIYAYFRFTQNHVIKRAFVFPFFFCLVLAFWEEFCELSIKEFLLYERPLSLSHTHTLIATNMHLNKIIKLILTSIEFSKNIQSCFHLALHQHMRRSFFTKFARQNTAGRIFRPATNNTGNPGVLTFFYFFKFKQFKIQRFPIRSKIIQLQNKREYFDLISCCVFPKINIWTFFS